MPYAKNQWLELMVKISRTARKGASQPVRLSRCVNIGGSSCLGHWHNTSKRNNWLVKTYNWLTLNDWMFCPQLHFINKFHTVFQLKLIKRIITKSLEFQKHHPKKILKKLILMWVYYYLTKTSRLKTLFSTSINFTDMLCNFISLHFYACKCVLCMIYSLQRSTILIQIIQLVLLRNSKKLVKLMRLRRRQLALYAN